MKTDLKSGKYLLMAVLFTFTISLQQTFGQYVQTKDNPNLDQIPTSLLNEIPYPGDAPLSSVIIIDNFDNFNLGVDFAESNVAAHLSEPTWYFTAYNTNGTHHTENGHDWYINNPGFGTSMRGDPVVAYDSLGNLFYENMYGSPNILGCKVISSTDNGQTWGTAVTAIAGIDKNWIAADQTAGPYANYVYTTMTRNGGGNFARSTDHGATWQTTFTPTTQNLPGMMVCVGPYQNIQGGAVYVVTNGGNTFASTYTFYRSLDGGNTFSQMSSQQFAGYVGTDIGGRHSVQNMRTRPYPFITADNSYGPNRGRLYCIYASNDPPGNGNKPDIWARYSDNGGTTWSAATRVNDDANSQQHHQWHPAPWCDKETGRLYVHWMDTRDTPTSDSAYIYATYSDDGAITFVENQQISNKKMKINCASCGGGGTPRYEGDYNGIISNNKVAMAGWTDFRNGNFMSAMAYFPDFALALDKTGDTLYTPSDMVSFEVQIPEVKLYSDTVLVSASIFPVPTAGNIEFSFPGGTEIISYPGSLSVNVTITGYVPEGNYQAIFVAKSPNGTPVHQRTANLKVIENSGFYINASADPDSICQGSSSQLTTEVTGGTPPFIYDWTPTTGLTDPTIPNPLTTITSSTKYFITVTDAALLSKTDSVLVTVLTAPSTPGQIIGPASVCVDSVGIYEIAPVPGATSYSWTVPADATILSGQNSILVNVQWGATSGTISVIAGNDCGNSSPSTLVVVVSQVPDPPATILGPDIACLDGTIDFSTPEVTGVTSYLWSVPEDVSIVAGQGTKQVSLIWGHTSGNISVVLQNYCGTSLPCIKSVIADSIPLPAGLITGKDSVCQNHSGYEYAIPVIPNAQTYIWTLPSGATISSGIGTNHITVNFAVNAQSGQMSVYGNNSCGNGAISFFEVIVSPCSGITENGLDAGIQLYPVPVKGTLNILVNGKEPQLEIQILDITGIMIYQDTWKAIPEKFHKEISLKNYPSGIYILKLWNENRFFIQKFILQNK